MDMVERVQLLAAGTTPELPPQFVRPGHERPKNSKVLEGIKVPTISLSQHPHLLVEQMSTASSEWGFFAITDHDILPELISRLQDASRRFFKLTQEEEAYANNPDSGSMEGYGTKMIKNHDKKLEWLDYYFHLLSPISKVDHTKWPRNPPFYREVNEEYGKELGEVVKRVLEALSEGLGLEKATLKKSLGGDEREMEMKINFYSPCPRPELALGVVAHTDMSALTVLVPNEITGLQIIKDGNWVAVDYCPGALYIDIGDQIEILSNGKYKSVLHRSTVNKEKVRMSWAVFCAPPKDAMIGPYSQLVDDKNLPLFKAKTYDEYRYSKIHKFPSDHILVEHKRDSTKWLYFLRVLWVHQPHWVHQQKTWVG